MIGNKVVLPNPGGREDDPLLLQVFDFTEPSHLQDLLINGEEQYFNGIFGYPVFPMDQAILSIVNRPGNDFFSYFDEFKWLSDDLAYGVVGVKGGAVALVMDFSTAKQVTVRMQPWTFENQKSHPGESKFSFDGRVFRYEDGRGRKSRFLEDFTVTYTVDLTRMPDRSRWPVDDSVPCRDCPPKQEPKNNVP